MIFGSYVSGVDFDNNKESRKTKYLQCVARDESEAIAFVYTQSLIRFNFIKPLISSIRVFRVA